MANKEQTHDNRQEDSHVDKSYIDTSYSEEFQNTPPKLGSITQVCLKVRSKFKNHRCCLWSSKAIILILAWNLIISVGFKGFLDPSLYTVTITTISLNFDSKLQYIIYSYYRYNPVLMLFGLSYGISALLLVFYPLAGFLADVRWGRYATVKNSLCFLFLSTVIMIILTGLALLGSTPIVTTPLAQLKSSPLLCSV